jgi:hypothetical protein
VVNILFLLTLLFVVDFWLVLIAARAGVPLEFAFIIIVLVIGFLVVRGLLLDLVELLHSGVLPIYGTPVFVDFLHNVKLFGSEGFLETAIDLHLL